MSCRETAASYLVGHRDEDRQEKHVNFEVIDSSNVEVSPSAELVSHVEKVRNSNSEIVAVRFDEIMTGDGRRINVMLTKWTKKIATNEGHVHGTPGIGTPMNNSRRQIGGENS